jgi:alkanesulfonate monooxygenase SsuD/methylene tetrahydromethanopterin reductase-like flavin-dependent oxidoreductase (luciferase family)
MADHLLRGRLFVGMARGYQSRWMNILCQKLGVGATYSDGSEADRSNRVLFSENFKIMKAAWSQELLRWDGPTYKVPNPLEGIPDWPPAETITSKYGAPGEIGGDGRTVQGVSVVPKPYSQPHPPLFQAFGASPPTIEWCGENDVVPTILFGAVERIRELLEIYRAAHASQGREIALGERVGVCRTFHIVEGVRGQDAVRAELLRRADSPEAGVFRRLADFGRYVIGDTFAAANDGLRGRVVKDIAAERGVDPFDALVDVVIADDLRTILWPMATDNDPASWDLRRRVWEDPHTMLGGSDAGAHLDRMCGAPYTTRFLADVLRGRKLVPLERAVQMITDDPARLFGLRGRGRVEEGFAADLVLFDPERIEAGQATLVEDLPGGTARLTAESEGIVRVLVNGVVTVEDGRATGAVPGTVLHAGRDTATVTAT